MALVRRKIICFVIQTHIILLSIKLIEKVNARLEQQCDYLTNEAVCVFKDPSENVLDIPSNNGEIFHLVITNSNINFEKNIFQNVENLTTVEINGTDVNGMEGAIFGNFTNLSYLTLKYNKNWDILRPNTFLGPKNLETLIIDSNNIKEIQNGCFNNLSNLQVLQLVHNNFKILPNFVFNSNKGVTSLFINNNNIETLEENSLEGLNSKHPGTIVYNTNRYSGWESLESMWEQVQNIGYDLMNITQRHPEGVNFLGYSQGALLARAILQTFPDHNVHNFISLSGPQAGQYGTAFLHIIFPGLALKSAFELFYSRVGQHTSVGNYWNDPYHQELYYNYSDFLPYINNAIPSKRSNDFKEGLVKLNNLVLIGGPQDNVITPWESAHFGYYDGNGTVINMVERDIYLDDKIGLKMLDSLGKLKIISVPGVNHFMWHRNMTMIDECVLPYLD